MSVFRAARSRLFIGLLLVAFCWLAVGILPVSAATPNSTRLRADYDVQADIHYAQGFMDVVSVAHVTNTSSDSIFGLTFNLLPLKTGNANRIDVTVGGTPVTPDRKGMSLIVNFSGPLAPDLGTNVRISYRAYFNTDTGGKKSLFMKKRGTIAAYRWIPWLSRHQRFKTPNFGESWVTGVSPRVTVTFNSDVDLKYATSGVKTDQASGTQQTFTATDVRDFNFAANPRYKVTSRDWNGVHIRVLTRTVDPSRLMKWTIRAMDQFSSKVGNYPYDHLDVAETPAGVGMESPAMTWIDGTLSSSRFTYIVVHETAHQWFYGVVGNNQGAYPFVDEATADFLTRDLLSTFRKSKCSKRRLDGTVWDYSGRCYDEVIYIQGGLYLRNYRSQVGAGNFWAGMHNFYADFRFRIADPRDMLDALDAASGYDSQLHADRFPSLYP